jgi:cytochrome c peroxidase
VDAGCTNCHREETALTDGSLHDVSSSSRGDRTSVFETPSLRFVAGTAPYFHDGRYATLRDLLYATRKTMGSTAHLGEADMAALEAYLRSL